MLFSTTEKRASSNYLQPIQKCHVLSPSSNSKASAEITLSTLLYFISITEGFSLPETINHRLLTVLNSLSYSSLPGLFPLVSADTSELVCAFPFKLRPFAASSDRKISAGNSRLCVVVHNNILENLLTIIASKNSAITSSAHP